MAADHARTLAKRLNLSDAEVQDIFIAGLLHDIGKIGQPDKLVSSIAQALAYRNLTLENRRLADKARVDNGSMTPQELERRRSPASPRSTGGRMGR